MRSFLVKVFITGLSLFLVEWILPGIEFSGYAALFVAAIILGIINAVVRPILILLTLPITILSLGLFLFVINALTYWFTAAIVPGFTINSFGTALLGALITGIISWGLNRLITE